jgi:osmoprotectant transport system permease protein
VKRAFAGIVLLPLCLAAQPAKVVVASKPFGESFLLCEMFAQLLESRGIPVERKPGLGATEIAFGALRTSAVDVYPEYTGTALVAILHDSLTDSLAADPRRVYARIASRLTAQHVGVLPSLGFQNTYAIAVTRQTAARYHLATITDLARESSKLRAGFTSDFIGRPDGLPGLRARYGLSPGVVRPLAPAVKYQALAEGAVDVVDGYSTDGLLAKYNLVVLLDDRHFFPPYEAVPLLSWHIVTERPDVVAALTLLSGRLDEPSMRALNRRVEVDRESVANVAAAELRVLGLVGESSASRPTMENRQSQTFARYLWAERRTLAALTARHLLLVLAALIAAIAVAVPLGLVLERSRHLAEPTIRALGVIQTVPSIALLAFMIPLLGVGTLPAIIALWLYALFPIVRGTFTGVRDADPDAVQAAEALGMTARQRLLLVRVPLAAPSIMSGIRTAAVISVGTATLAAFIGAGGLGEPIVAGLSLADSRMVLSGALPAAILAIVVDGMLAIAERRVAPAHLRVRHRTPSAIS